MSQLKSISPVDGRYYKKTKVLRHYFSESALIKYRIHVEIEYFIALCELPLKQLRKFPKNKIKIIRNIYKEFNHEDALKVKEIEKTTNHDVKAVEYFIKEKFEAYNLSDFKEFIHFGLTSQDINNTAMPMSIHDAYNNVILKELKNTCSLLKKLSKKWDNVPMIARTHGQAASPTRMGKEINVFIERLENQIKLLPTIKFMGKFGGASGNFNAHHVAYPNHNWKKFADKLLKNSLKLERQQTTTQIEHYDNIAALMNNLVRINNILIDLCRDMWTYISMDYFKQKIKKNEVGSSAMPHKVNPIDFENAEGNLAISNSLFKFLSNKLPISRLQRDLTDSTVSRNIGVPFAHQLISFSSIIKGLEKIIINNEKIENDLENNWAVCAEAIQTILRRENYPNPYEKLKELTRTKSKIDKEIINKFINKLEVSETIKDELRNINPSSYTGI
ncbi:MAG: adenylosuccinate lyase [Flavobacteriales bacterium]|nr:adenylosuccinate lyase [Flavobacteriales bacterium]